MLEIAADASPLRVHIDCGLGRARINVPKLNLLVHPVADRLDTLPAWLRFSEQLNGDGRQQIRIRNNETGAETSRFRPAIFG